jgi:hypothetical protein
MADKKADDSTSVEVPPEYVPPTMDEIEAERDKFRAVANKGNEETKEK